MASNQNSTNSNWHPETLAIRSGIARTNYQEHSEPIFVSSSFVFDNAAQAAARFSNEDPGFMYSRAGNPSVTAFETRLAALEGAQACLGTASGMAAITATCLSLCSAGDHMIVAHEMFGATVQLMDILRRFDISVTAVPLTEPDAWAQAMTERTRMLYLETPSNPLMSIGDISALAQIAHKHDALLVVDNCFCSPALQQPISLGADLVIHSATKYLDGQGRIMGGAVAGSEQIIREKIAPFVRTSGAVLAPFNAWVALKGMETLSLRMQQHSRNAEQLAQWLSVHPAVRQVYYPGLSSHPQHELAMRQQATGGATISFEVVAPSESEQRSNAWTVIDRCQLLSRTANLGDVKSTITHPASTTHARVDSKVRLEAGIAESLIRVAVGLENPLDLQADLDLGLNELRA